MTRQEHLLTIVGEECAEIAQRCSKALRFGMDEVQKGQEMTNDERILEEFDDLVAVMEILYSRDTGGIDDVISWGRVQAKKEKVEKYLKYAEECGTLTQ